MSNETTININKSNMPSNMQINEKKLQGKLTLEYENYSFDDSILKEEHQRHVNVINNYLFNGKQQFDQLKKDINDLHETISNIQAKHHNEYICTFNNFMESVKCDIKEKIQRMDKIQEEKEKDENILRVIAERNLFREEAIRLNLGNKTISIELNNFRIILKSKEEEIEKINKKWIECASHNKQLIYELDTAVKLNEELVNKYSLINNNNNNDSRKYLLPSIVNNNNSLSQTKLNIINLNNNKKNKHINNISNNNNFYLTDINIKNNKSKESIELDELENENFEAFKKVIKYQNKLLLIKYYK